MGKAASEEQKKILSERLAKARAAKRKPSNASIHETIRNLPDSHPVNVTKVKSWIKYNEEMLHSLVVSARSDAAIKRKVNNEINILSMYIHNMIFYLRTGLWLDSVYGKDRENKVVKKCTVMAYDDDGYAKRSVGVHYPDIGLYTQEMKQEDELEKV